MSTNATNPSTLFGGTWEAYAQGRVLIGAGSGTDTRKETKEFAAGSTGGEYNHVLTVNELATHNHTRGTMNITGNCSASSWGGKTDGAFSRNSFTTSLAYNNPNNEQSECFKFDASQSWSGATSNTGANDTHNNIQPYIVCYIFRRVN